MPHFVHGDRRLHFDDTGGAGAPLLLLHGLGSRGSDWQRQLEALAPEFRVLTLDFPGHGASDPLRGAVGMADLAADARALLAYLDIGRAHIAGLSLGGMVAFQLAADCPEWLLSLTVINSGPGFARGRWNLRWQLALRSLLIRAFGLPALAGGIAPKLFPYPQQQTLREQFLHSIAAADKKSYLHILRAIGRFDVRAHLRDCHLPALILCGDRDYTPVEFKREYAALMPDARLRVVPTSRHATPMDQAETCNREMLRFLREIESVSEWRRAVPA